MLSDPLHPDHWRSRLRPAAPAPLCRFDDVTASTNLNVREMAAAGAPAWSISVAEQQTAGRGRLGRSWHSPAGQGLWCSVLLRPQLNAERAPLITFCAALAMASAVEEACGLRPLIKWPNDLVLGGRKICGILLEVSAGAEGIRHVVVGTGLNVRRGAYPAELAHQAASLEDFGQTPRRSDLLVAYHAHLQDAVARLESEGFGGIRSDYEARCCTLGSRVRVTGGAELTGTAEALDDTGALLVRTDDGTLHRVLAGDVSVRGVMGYV